ncbi:MAG: class I SAM-dependent methyltransferase [Clostridiales bacterium]|nr:class I SAM-dependent methyltransferase [Clostridiales bacterium]
MRHCIACGAILPDRCLFELREAPVSAQDIPDAATVGEDRGMTLTLHQCDACGLVQLGCEPVHYYRDVIRAGGATATMRDLRTEQYRHLIETWHLEGKRFLEVGCGRGEFLNFLRDFPVEAYGIEHKEELVRMARADGLRVWREFTERADQVFGQGPEASMLPAPEEGWTLPDGPFDVFLSFNFLEHQPHPDVMLRSIRNNLAEDGMGLITVPSLEYILERGSYYELLHDHIAYYSFETLRNLLEHCGFAVLEETRINRDTISMIVRKCAAVEDGDRRQVSVENMEPLFLGREAVLASIREWKTKLAAEGKKFAIWGASHQGFTLASTAGLAGSVEYIIDSAPFKQGRFAPASHIPIVSPEYYFEKPVDAILIVAPGYTDEIAEIIRRRYAPDVSVLTMRINRIEQLSKERV